MTETQMKKWIDNASYESLLSKWRNASLGDPFFQGMMGEYYAQKMKEKRRQVGNEEHTQASKNIGWSQ